MEFPIHSSLAAQIAGVDERTIRRWCKAGLFVAQQGPNGIWLIQESSLRHYLNERAGQPKEERA